MVYWSVIFNLKSTFASRRHDCNTPNEISSPCCASELCKLYTNGCEYDCIMVSGTVNFLYGLIKLFVVVGVGRDECSDDNDAG